MVSEPAQVDKATVAWKPCLTPWTGECVKGRKCPVIKLAFSTDADSDLRQRVGEMRDKTYLIIRCVRT